MTFDEDVMKPYPFKLKPPTKSSTSVLTASVCQRCGCKLDGKHGGGKVGCKCACHEGAR